MKKHIFAFLKRGLTLSVGGPIILAIIYGILGATGEAQTLTPGEVCMGILTISFMAFIAAGITTVYDIEQLPLFSAILLHGVALYLDYILVYLLNGWLKSELIPVLIFTAVFVAGYAVIWLIIYFSTRNAAGKLNKRLQA